MSHTPGPFERINRSLERRARRNRVYWPQGGLMDTSEYRQVEKEYAALAAEVARLRTLLTELLVDFESGYIANHAVRAEQRRKRYAQQIRAALAEGGKG